MIHDSSLLRCTMRLAGRSLFEDAARNPVSTAVAVAQALLWFFALPAVMKPYWPQFWLGLTPLAGQVLMNSMGLLYFVSYAIVMLPIYYYNFPFFEQYKISNKPWAWRSVKESDRDQFWSLAKKSLKLFFFNYCILVPMLTAGKYFTFNTPMSFSTDDWPSYTTLARDNILMTFTHEFFFYWAHRISHIRGFYKYHKVHHEWKQNMILASQHEHPIDYLITIASPALLAIIICAPHSFTLFQWIVWVVIANIDDHVGYAFPWSPVRWFLFAARTDQHEFHHSKNMGCFASKLNIYDTLFGSEQPYLDYCAKKKRDGKQREAGKKA